MSKLKWRKANIRATIFYAVFDWAEKTQHHPDEADQLIHRNLDLGQRPWWHRPSLEGQPKMSNERLQKFREKSFRTPHPRLFRTQ